MTVAPLPLGPDPRAGRVAFALAFVVVAAGLTYLGLAPEHWLRGVLTVAGGLVFAGLVRWCLPDRKAGPLMVRGRVFDGLCFVLVGVAVAAFGLLVR